MGCQCGGLAAQWNDVVLEAVDQSWLESSQLGGLIPFCFSYVALELGIQSNL